MDRAIFIYTIIFIFIIFIVLIIWGAVFATSSPSSSSPNLIDCEFVGPIPSPLENEVIGAASSVTLKSNLDGFISPCFVYFTKNLTFDKTNFGIRLPPGIYNVFVQYLSLAAVDGDTVTDQLIQTSVAQFNKSIIIQSFIGGRTASFENHHALTEYDTIELAPNANILRIEAAIKGFPHQTLKMDRIEILFEKVLVI